MADQAQAGRPESRKFQNFWMPVFTGMTKGGDE
jgi:hypothetical protein